MHTEILTVGFADLTHFTPLVRQTGDAAAARQLQTCLEALGEAVVRHGGQLRKYIGDSVLFTFADPSAAMSAAREIAALRWQAAGLELRYIVALATGPVVITELGHASLRLEDILGETVNRAALLMRPARESPDGLALDEATRGSRQ